MVVCKCRKATKLYCFVHRVPVCGECICFSEHRICVISTYSEWVIDGDYDWPPKCCLCRAVLEEASGSQTTRLGCLHVVHTDCFVSHIRSFPPHTAPAGYVCPMCSTPIWPPKRIKDSGSRLHAKLKDAIMQTGQENNLFGNLPASFPSADSHRPPPAFASDPLVTASSGPSAEKNKGELFSSAFGEGFSYTSVSEIVEIDGPNSAGNLMRSASPPASGAATRKGSVHADRKNSETIYYASDEDGNHKKYDRRGPMLYKVLRKLPTFWSSALPTLPVTAPPRKDASTADEVHEGRLRHQRSSRLDSRKILLLVAIMACVATMGILYYRLAQGGIGKDLQDDMQL